MSARARLSGLILLAVVAGPMSFADLSGQGRGGGAPAGPVAAQPVGQPRFEYVGPQNAGRIAAAAAVAGKPGVYYAGAASGGVWKSSDGGVTWKPTFDGQSSQAIGALAVSQSNPNIVWAGTGEAWAVRDMDMMGDGIYKSTDAGETWTRMGLVDTGRIGTIAIHPTNENIVMVCALGRATGPQKERGVFRTEDGGRTWQHVLFVNQDTGCSGLQIAQQNPNVVLASTTFGFCCAICRPEQPVSWFTKSTCCQVLPPSSVRKTPRSFCGPVARPSAQTRTMFSFVG